MTGAQSLIRNGLAQTDLDMNNFRLLNLDTSNLALAAIPPTINPPANNFLRSWNASTLTWGFARPTFANLAGNLTSAQQLAITSVGTLLAGTWNASPIDAAYLPRLNQITAPNAAVSLANFRIVNLADPINPTDAVNKRFMDALLQGLNPKQAVRTASRNNITLSGLFNLQGIDLQVGDRVLVKAQIPNQFNNGIWIANTGAWTRATDCDTAAELNGAYCMVLEGVFEAGTSWVQTNTIVTLGVDVVRFVQFSGANQIVAGNGLEFDGTTLNAVGTFERIAVGATIDISTSYHGQASINTVGTITTGLWRGTVLEPGWGGTGFANVGHGIELMVDLKVLATGSDHCYFYVTDPTDVVLPPVGTLATLAQPETFNNKRINKRLLEITTSAQPNIDTDTTDTVAITQLATAITSMSANLTGTPLRSQELEIWFFDDGTPRAITWGASFVNPLEISLPVITETGFWTYTKFVYSPERTQWVLVSALTHI